MAKNPKMVICRNCNNPMSAKAKICPSCGAKNKKPFYKKAWFIILAVIVVIGVIGTIGGGGNDGEKIEWSDIELSENEKPKETPESSEKPENPSELVDGMRPEFKEAMDSYEEFMDEYCKFMKKYSENPSDIGLLADYTKFMGEYADFVKDFEKWDDGEINAAETKYYIEVATRVNQKLLEIEKPKETPESSEKSENPSELVDGMRPEFKEAMDSYEEFMDEYCEFMKKYSENPSDIGLLADYTKFMGEYADFVEAFEKWDDGEMNAAETKYYIEVATRVNQKLLEVAG